MSDADYIKLLEKDNHELRRINSLLRKDPKLLSFKFEDGCNKVNFSFNPEAINDILAEHSISREDIKKMLKESFIKQISKEVDDILSEPEVLKKLGL